jgi:hypothetical protein
LTCLRDVSQSYERAVQRQKSAQTQYLAKKRAEAHARKARREQEPLPDDATPALLMLSSHNSPHTCPVWQARGEEPLPEEDTSTNPAFKPIAKPSRLDSLLVTNQMGAYLQQVNQFCGQSFVKLFLMQSLNAQQQ